MASSRPPLSELLPEQGDASDMLFGFLEWVEEGGRSPWPHQEEALMELAAGHHVLLETPTGSGKSLVALGLHAMAFGRGERSVYTAPIKALVNEKFFSLCADLGAEYVGLLTGDASVNRDAPILCCTAEVLAQIAITEGDAAGFRHVVMDEFHYYGDRARGMAWHLPLVALAETRFLLMSATLGDTAAIREALAERSGRAVKRVFMNQRPVPLHWEYSQTPIHETIPRLQRQGRLPAYVVHPSRRESTEQAQSFMSLDFLDKDAKKELKQRLKGERFPSPFGTTLKRHLLHGVGLHHAGLLPRYRLLVERLAQEGRLALISGTDTLGVGVNVPIRTVVMTSLSRFNGETVTWPTVRDFHQVAGRAGRAGFDTEGLVVVQAPPWTIENLQRKAKAELKGKKKWRKASAPDRVKPWTGDTFERLRDGKPESLSPVFSITPGLMLEVLRREHRAPTHRFGGYGALMELLQRSHLSDAGKRAERRRACTVFRGLRKAGVLQVVPAAEGRGKVVVPDPGLPEDLSLTHGLSVWLVEAVALLDVADPDHARNVVSVAESVADDPYPILKAQVRREKGRKVADLKAQGMDYEDRMEVLEKVTHPKPLKDWLWGVFEPWSRGHPWVEGRGPRPKGIVREMFETGATFGEYVRELGLGRDEGILLRYLAQVWRLLARGLPEVARTDEVLDLIGWLRGVLAHTDDSLISAWESMAAGDGAPRDTAAPDEVEIVRDPRAFAGRLRAEVHALLQALAAGDYDEAAEGLRGDQWEGDQLKALLKPLLTEPVPFIADHRARLGQHLRVRKEAPRHWRVEQDLLDDEGERVGLIRAVARAEPGEVQSGPVLELDGIEVW